MGDLSEWDEGNAGDWRHQVAGLVGLTGSDYRKAIIQITGSTRPDSEWRQAICEAVGTGRHAIDWTMALNDYAVAHSMTPDAADEDWQLLIVPVLTALKG